MKGHGRIRYSFFIDGFLDSTGNGAALVSFGVTGGGGLFRNTCISGPGPVGTVGDAVLDFNFGVPFVLSGSLEVSIFQFGDIGPRGFGKKFFLNTAGSSTR